MPIDSRKEQNDGITCNPPRQITSRATSRSTDDAVAVWEDLLEVRASRLAAKSAGLGLFARRPFKMGKVVSSHAGESFDPGECLSSVFAPEITPTHHFFP